MSAYRAIIMVLSVALLILSLTLWMVSTRAYVADELRDLLASHEVEELAEPEPVDFFALEGEGT